MKKLILLAMVIIFTIIVASAGFAQESIDNQVKLQQLQSTLQYLTDQRAAYLSNAKITLGVMESQIKDVQMKIQALQPKPNPKKNPAKKEKLESKGNHN